MNPDKDRNIKKKFLVRKQGRVEGSLVRRVLGNYSEAGAQSAIIFSDVDGNKRRLMFEYGGSIFRRSFKWRTPWGTRG